MTTDHPTPGAGRPDPSGGGEESRSVAERAAPRPNRLGSGRTASPTDAHDPRVIPVAQLKRDHPIAQVIAGYGVRLRPRGRRAVGNCPFHDDAHPSLVVYPDTASFYCFGCRTGGDAITFIRRYEGLSFLDAIARLGGTRPPAAPAPTRERLTFDDRMVLTAACGVYHETLLHHRDALSYLAARGVHLSVVRRCRLGFADGRSLRPYLERRRLGVRRATELGLLWPKGGEPLAGRIVIPELRGGQCRWMLGRALTADHQPKYWGLSLPKPILGYERVQGRPWVIVVEGASTT